MTKRATFTQAEIERAIRAAEKLGREAVWTDQGIRFVEKANVPPPPSEDRPEPEPLPWS